MCRQYLTLYSWCQCEEDAGYQACSARKDNGCPGLAFETVHMQCFCNGHATKKFKTEKQSQKKARSLRSSNSSRSSRYSDASLEEKTTQGTPDRRRWYRFWSRSF